MQILAVIQNLWSWLFSVEGYMARWHCGDQPLAYGIAHIASDCVTAITYFTIASILLWLHVRFRGMTRTRLALILFSMFIYSCGLVHAVDALIWWMPYYNLLMTLKVVMAVVSFGTGVILATHHSWLAKFLLPGYVHELTNLKDIYETLIEHSPIMINVWDAKGNIVLWNPSCGKLLGITQHEAQNHEDLHRFFYPNQKEADASAAHVAEASGEFSLFKVHTAKLGIRHQLWANFRTMHGETLGFGVDIHREVSARRDVEKANQELLRTNAELEQFAYVASHDLQEPLRKVLVNTDRIERSWKSFQEAADEADSAKADKYLARITDSIERTNSSALRMRVLIHDLLMLSRSMQPVNETQSIDLKGVLQRMTDVFAEHLLSSNTNLVLMEGSIPLVRANEDDVERILINLISNGLKFCKQGDSCTVTIEWRIESEFLAIDVKDTGIGFDMKDAELILQPFSRLHPRSDYEGTGIGLSICRKLSQRQGGKLTAFGEPGVGATFTFTLPLDETQESFDE